jgi:hypothetical protein
MVGTAPAYDRCARCHHARLRHVSQGHGECSQVTTITDTTTPGHVEVRTIRCLCPAFTTPEELF